LSEAIAEVTARPVHRHRLEVHRLSEEIIVIDDTGSRGAADAVESVKTISMISARQRRVVVVAGPIDFADESDYDSLDAFGAFMVRLNINQVFAVGPMARALFLSVGREGSWDGESQHCVDVATAYDEVRAFVRPKDVVLVMGTTAESLLPIVEKLVEDFR
jgi:UDP-N-acetylmuramyl pentapeptide synthase